jgi:hypothetical protein
MIKTLAMKIAKYIHMVRRRFGLRCFLFVADFSKIYSGIAAVGSNLYPIPRRVTMNAR